MQALCKSGCGQTAGAPRQHMVLLCGTEVQPLQEQCIFTINAPTVITLTSLCLQASVALEP